MRAVSDLVRDSRLHTSIQGRVTRHLIETSGRGTHERKIRREQQWRREEIIGEGTFGVVWKDVLIEGDNDCDVKERAVKMIRKQIGSSHPVDYSRELEAAAKFSHPRVGFRCRCLFFVLESRIMTVMWRNA